MNELKPCPFCGGKALTNTFLDYDDLEYTPLDTVEQEVTCENERCINGWWLSPKEWNTRPIEHELETRIVELTTLYKQTKDAFDLSVDIAEKSQVRIAELEEFIEGHDPFEEFPPKERGFECSIVVLGKFEYQDEFTPFTNWDLCVYWFDKESWHPLNDYVKGDDIVRWYVLPPEEV